jgi:hypothetical protein
MSFNVQADYQHWTTTSLNYYSSYIKDAYGVHAGFEYSNRIINSNYIIEKYYIALGARMEQSYLVINNNHLNDYALTFGGGKNFSRYLSLSAGVEVGKKGSSSLGQIQENYTQFNIGLTAKELWFGTKKLGRFH